MEDSNYLNNLKNYQNRFRNTMQNNKESITPLDLASRIPGTIVYSSQKGDNSLLDTSESVKRLMQQFRSIGVNTDQKRAGYLYDDTVTHLNKEIKPSTEEKLTTKHQNGGMLNKVELTSTTNVVPEGSLHKNKHEDFGIEVSKKGIPVITVDDDSAQTLTEIQQQAESVVQHAEIEREEIIFNKELTDKIEGLRQQWKEAKGQAKKDLEYQAGLILTKEVLFNTEDNTQLINKISEQV